MAEKIAELTTELKRNNVYDEQWLKDVEYKKDPVKFLETKLLKKQLEDLGVWEESWKYKPMTFLQAQLISQLVKKGDIKKTEEIAGDNPELRKHLEVNQLLNDPQV